MEVLMPKVPLNNEALAEVRENYDLDEFFLAKLAFINTASDLDVYQLQGEERIKHLVCAWDIGFVLCNRCENECKSLPDFLQNFLANLVHYSLGIWFSFEWEKCSHELCCSLLVSMFRMRPRLMELPRFSKVDWNGVMNIGLRPWKSAYFRENKRLFGVFENDNATMSALPSTISSVEDFEPMATMSDIQHINSEGYVLTLLRLMKLFDAGCMDSVKRFSICAISAWNQEQQQHSSSVNPEYDIDLKRCLNMIGHTHLMAVFERDSAIGFEIDNMINNIRFYYKCICDAQNGGKDLNEYLKEANITPSHLLALTCVRLGQTVEEFTESILPDLYRENFSTLFGAVAHAYATYLLASILVDMNKFNTGDFTANLEKYKSKMRAYVVERERSERFILDELHKQKLQSTCHNITCTVKDITNLKAAIGKGNHSSNLVNHKPIDIQSEQERAELFEIQNEKRYDPVFQTMPNNEIVTNEFYGVLSKTKYKGWHFAKLVLLLKIIGRELNDIEKWCYHPGLTTQFMMSLEHRLAKHFEHLALIFEDHIFMEQEFWLTAFYLRPIRVYYDKVIYCGTRFHRTVNFLNKGERDEVILKAAADRGDEGTCAFMNAKYGLLSSTFDVKQIAQMTSVDTAENDYELLAKALRKLRLPENIVKDLLTVTFSPRHANFTWAAEWPILRKRCKMLLNNPAYKRELVESNMAEANDRLKYLKVDYDKYKNWPQLDYGSIEEGYENDYIGEELEDSGDDYEIHEDINKNKGQAKRQQFAEVVNEKDLERIDQQIQAHLNELEMSRHLKRTSARRAAAVIASAMLKEDYTAKAAKKKDETPAMPPLVSIKPENVPTESRDPNDEVSVTDSKTLADELFQHRNSTAGFLPLADLWDHENHPQGGESQFCNQSTSQKMSNIFGIISTLCTTGDVKSDTDESSSDGESFEMHSIHEAMNVSDDTEISYSSIERSQDGWEQLLPSFIVENLTRPGAAYSNDTGVSSSEKCNEEIMESEASDDNEGNYESVGNVVDSEDDNDDEVKNSHTTGEENNPIKMKQKSVEIKSEKPNEQIDETLLSKIVNDGNDGEQKRTQHSIEHNASRTKNRIKFEYEEYNWLSAFKEKIASLRDLARNVRPTDDDDDDDDDANQSLVEPFKIETSYESSRIAKITGSSSSIAVAQADCTDSIANSNSIVDVQSTSNEAFKDDRFVVSTTTITTTIAAAATAQELSNEVSQDETETAIDSTAYSKTEDYASVDGAASIETITDDSNSRYINRNESAVKTEIEIELELPHSTTQNENPPYHQLTGKPKSFSEILAAQLSSEESSSQSSNGTPIPSMLCIVTSDAPDIIEGVALAEKRKSELVDLCLRKKCFVPLMRLEPMNAREPIVRVKRLNLDNMINDKVPTRQKRKFKSKPKYFYMEDNEDNLDPASHGSKARKRGSTTPVLGESDEEYTPKQSRDAGRLNNRKLLMMKKNEQQKRSRAKSFSVVPRSASGLKVCISSLCDIRPPIDCIEISSSSESDVMEVQRFPVEYANLGNLIIDQDDPLFEVEADIELLR